MHQILRSPCTKHGHEDFYTPALSQQISCEHQTNYTVQLYVSPSWHTLLNIHKIPNITSPYIPNHTNFLLQLAYTHEVNHNGITF
jgi:hypothetical protein